MSRLTLMTATLALGLPLLAAAPAGAAAATCQGRPATIVGEPGGRVSGTGGDDVIVTNGAMRTAGHAGDDLICVTGRTHRARVLGNGGDDSVVESSRGYPQVDLGGGADHFRNLTRFGAVVDAGDDAGPGDDVMVSRRGGLVVISGVADQPNGDMIRLGTDGDIVTLRGVPTGTVDGGGGNDDLRLATTAPAAWVVDRPEDVVTVDGVPLDVHGFENYDVADLAWSSFDFVGSAGPERLWAAARPDPGENRPFTARMGAGDDGLFVTDGLSGPLEGGPGRDRLELSSGAAAGDPGPDVSVRLGSGVLRVPGKDEVRVASFQDLFVRRFDQADVAGSARPEQLSVLACRAQVDGLGGDDLITFGRRTACPGHGGPGVIARGRGGDDRLFGAATDDTLLGGPGDDLAWGSAGRDVCRAEDKGSCEA